MNGQIENKNSVFLRWEIGIPILTNRFIMTQVGMALGIPASVIALFIWVFSLTQDSIPQEPSNDWIKVLLLIVILFGLTALFIQVVYKNRSYAVFEIDEKGIKQYPMKNTAKKNTAINTILFFAGLAKGKPGYAGTALIAETTNSAFITWKNIKMLKFYPREKAIAVKNGWRTVLVVYCTEVNYQEVSEFMRYKSTSMSKGPSRW